MAQLIEAHVSNRTARVLFIFLFFPLASTVFQFFPSARPRPIQDSQPPRLLFRDALELCNGHAVLDVLSVFSVRYVCVGDLMVSLRPAH